MLDHAIKRCEPPSTGKNSVYRKTIRQDPVREQVTFQLEDGGDFQ